MDTAAHTECTISPHYDSLIAKLIVHANSRSEAIRKMERSLEMFVIEGVKTTIPLHQRIMVADDEDGMLLSVTSLRLRLLRNDRLLPYARVKLDDDTFSIHRQVDGTIWFCTSVGLVCHKRGQTR